MVPPISPRRKSQVLGTVSPVGGAYDDDLAPKARSNASAWVVLSPAPFIETILFECGNRRSDHKECAGRRGFHREHFARLARGIIGHNPIGLLPTRIPKGKSRVEETAKPRVCSAKWPYPCVSFF